VIAILHPGMLTSVQDLGRPGHRQLGINPGGALNTMALSAANLLVGNPVDAAGLEITMGACELRFDSDTRIALSGDDFAAQLDGHALAPYWSVPVRAGQVLKLAPTGPHPGQGIRTYLAVAGGIAVPAILGSRSTDLKAGFGGLEGRALRKGDRLPLGAPDSARKPIAGASAHQNGAASAGKRTTAARWSRCGSCPGQNLNSSPWLRKNDCGKNNGASPPIATAWAIASKVRYSSASKDAICYRMAWYRA